MLQVQDQEETIRYTGNNIYQNSEVSQLKQ